MTRLRIGVLFGGRSTEHEVSIVSARNVVRALDPERFEPVLFGIDKAGGFRELSVEALAAGALELQEGAGAQPPLERLAALDVVFPVLHGPMGEDGTMQGLLELLDVPYVGCGVLGSAVGMDKDVAKRLLRDSGIGIAPFRTLRRADFERLPAMELARASELGFPLFTKPANAGSSVGVRRVATAAELTAALKHAFEFDTKVLVEAAIEGREIECAVLGNDEPLVSVPGEIVVQHSDGFYSYEAKYQDENGALLQIPARLSEAQAAEARELSRRTYRALECRGMTRVDFFLRPTGEWLVNEVNTIPGFTAISMYPKLWEASGLPPRALVTRLIELALEHQREQRLLRREAAASSS